MANPEHVKVVKRGAERLAEWQKEHPGERLDLKDTALQDINLEGANLTLSDFSRSDLRNINLSGANLEAANFTSSTLRKVNLEKANLHTVLFSNTKISDSNMGYSDLRYSFLDSAEIYSVSLKYTDFRQAKLENIKFTKCDMDSILLQGVTVSSDTLFDNPISIRNGQIDRYTLACLGKNRGGLSDGNLMVMNIHDDVAKLRSDFSGIWGLFHLLAIFAFCVPYLWFFIEQRIGASFSDVNTEQSMTLLDALLRYIWNGGVDWKVGWKLDVLSFGTFLIFLIYNALRISLLYKTKKLETEQDVSGVPCDFSFSRSTGWQFVFALTQIGLYAYLICVVLNVYHFLLMRIPI